MTLGVVHEGLVQPGKTKCSKIVLVQNFFWQD